MLSFKVGQYSCHFELFVSGALVSHHDALLAMFQGFNVETYSSGVTTGHQVAPHGIGSLVRVNHAVQVDRQVHEGATGLVSPTIGVEVHVATRLLHSIAWNKQKYNRGDVYLVFME